MGGIGNDCGYSGVGGGRDGVLGYWPLERVPKTLRFLWWPLVMEQKDVLEGMDWAREWSARE